jgi:hypothetical protein
MMPEQNEQSEIFDRVWEMYLDPLKSKIFTRAQAIAQAEDQREVTAIDVFEALREFVPGKPITQSAGGSAADHRVSGWFDKNVTGFIAITAILTIVLACWASFLSFSKSPEPLRTQQVISWKLPRFSQAR